jgi:hypothetical protein
MSILRTTLGCLPFLAKRMYVNTCLLNLVMHIETHLHFIHVKLKFLYCVRQRVDVEVASNSWYCAQNNDIIVMTMD